MSRTRNNFFLYNALGLMLVTLGQGCSDDSKDPNSEMTSSSGTETSTGSEPSTNTGDTGNTGNTGNNPSDQSSNTPSVTPTSGATSNSKGSNSTSSNTSTGSTSTSSPGNSSGTSTSTLDPAMDPYLWLEEQESTRALQWVKEQNAASKPKLEGVLGFNAIKTKLKSQLDSADKIPEITKIGDKVYNFWQDKSRVRGVWRRTTLASYQTDSPNWELVLDLDDLATKDSKKWVWKGANCIAPAGDLCLISLSDGGKDAVVIREFNTTTKQFVTQNPFKLEEAKSIVDWIDKDNILVGTKFDMDALSNSGYPRFVKRWTRGQTLAQAKQLAEVPKDQVIVTGQHITSGGVARTLVTKYLSFFEREYHLLGAMDKLSRIDVPKSARIGFWGPWMYVELKEDWTIGAKTWKQGSVLIINQTAFTGGDRKFQALYEPSRGRAFGFITATKNHLLVGEMHHVNGRLYEWSYNNTDGWKKREVQVPQNGSFSVKPFDAETDDQYLMSYSDFLTPSTYYLGEAGKDARTTLRSLKEAFPAQNLEVQQFFAVSKDGTSIPYFQISRKNLVQNGENPTILYGYGGFQRSAKPQYKADRGIAWLDKGGVFVVANIRGGGEYGPAWHQAAIKDKRQNAFDDFIAVAEHLQARKITSKAKLGVTGRSNGGLLTGVMLTQRPDLFGAVFSQVPLLDMKRFSKLPPGGSWMGEYGNPDLIEDWAYISKYSPYHNVKAGVDYPPVLFNTSTKDDRVHPAHARKMMARMMEQGHKNLFYYEDTEGGHAGGANNEQTAYTHAVVYAFFAKHLGLALQ